MLVQCDHDQERADQCGDHLDQINGIKLLESFENPTEQAERKTDRKHNPHHKEQHSGSVLKVGRNTKYLIHVECSHSCDQQQNNGQAAVTEQTGI